MASFWSVNSRLQSSDKNPLHFHDTWGKSRVFHVTNINLLWQLRRNEIGYAGLQSILPFCLFSLSCAALLFLCCFYSDSGYKKARANHIYNRIWSFWLTSGGFVVKKINLTISQFSTLLLLSGYLILLKIWKWLKLLNSVPLIKKTRVNHVCNRIWSFWLTFSGFTVK